VSDGNTTSATLTPDHEAYLASQAIDTDLARSLGVRSLTSPQDTAGLGDVWVNWANFPAILFPWTSPDGRVEYQVRPDKPTKDSRGRDRKYVFRKGMTPVLWAVRPVRGSTKILIVEGTKQSLAAASYAPAGVSVYGIAGCRSWQINGAPIPDLGEVDGCDVTVILDADAASNSEVYDAGMALSATLVLEGADKVLFARLTGADEKAGLDDILAGRPVNRRTTFLNRLISGAKAKPADAKPKSKGNGKTPGQDGRTTVICNRDRLAVIDDLTGALINRLDGTELFNHGGVISRLNGVTMSPVDRGTFHDVVQETAVTVNENEGANGVTYTFSWPDSGTMSAVMSRASKFSPLDRISRAPFARPDGTIVTTPGYDEQTRTILLADPVFEGLTVPESPSPEEISAARELVLSEWLGDFPLEGDPDRANVLGLIVTPAIRGMVPKVPLAVVDGLQMGVGKNLLADAILTVYTGEPARPMNAVEDKDELRKQITSAFRTGQEFFVFDEAHTVEGAPLAQALTAETWQDRILGVSTMAEFPNRVTWMSLGNQVQVRGDLTRRVYRIALRPTYADPQDRKAESFRHPGQSGMDLLSWTRKNRKELMGAILTLVRAWFAQGSPRPKRGVSFGSFEIWERITGGIVETAGLDDFLGNLKVWRSESDFDTQYWFGHLGWLYDQFGQETFRTADVRGKALSDPAAYLAPPKLDDPSDKGYGKALGEAYSRLRGRRYDGYWIERMGFSSGHVSQWRVFNAKDDLPPPPQGPVQPSPDPEHTHPAPCGFPGVVPCICTRDDDPQGVGEPVDIPEPDPAPYNEHGEARGADESDTFGGETDSEEATGQVADGDTSLWDLLEGISIERGGVGFPVIDTSQSIAGVLTLDLETGDATELYRRGPGYVRIGATAADDEDVITYDGPGSTVPRAVVADIRHARTITGHNVMAFDLPALVREGGLTMPEIHAMAAGGQIFDALIVARFLDPPMARDKGVDASRKYDLGSLLTKHGLSEKLTDVSKALAKKYGGWDAIPIDDSEDGRAFKSYMIADVEGSRRLHATLLEQLGGTVPDYLVREHRIAAIATQISVNGFLVDQELLATRVADIRERKSSAMRWLADNCNIPTADAKGKEYASPLASKAGKEALETALREAGATSLWRTPASGEIQVSADHMVHLGQEYHHLPAVLDIAKQVHRIVSARTVYETISNSMAPDGRVHSRVSFKQATGRWSSTDPGLTVMGKRGGRHVERAVLLPDPGDVLVSFDLSQVDMRAVAGLSQDQGYIRMLMSEDPHTELAVSLFGDARYREQAKAIGHGWNYGESLRRISMENDIEPELVQKFDRSMRERFARLVEWREEVRALAGSGQLLDNGFGRMMRADPQRAHTQGPALMGQGAARDLMMEGMLRLPAEVLPMLRAQIHDEIVCSVPADQVTEVSRAVIDALSFEWRGVPILADVSRAGTDWSKCYEKG
jgi:hypothetical protein